MSHSCRSLRQRHLICTNTVGVTDIATPLALLTPVALLTPLLTQPSDTDHTDHPDAPHNGRAPFSPSHSNLTLSDIQGLRYIFLNAVFSFLSQSQAYPSCASILKTFTAACHMTPYLSYCFSLLIFHDINSRHTSLNFPSPI